MLLAVLLCVVVLGAVRFGRNGAVGVLTRTGDPIAFETETSREIGPTVVDERQYLMMVAFDRGAERTDFDDAERLWPWSSRPLIPWVAAQLPIADEGFALGTVNLVLTMVGLAAVAAALRRSGASDTAVWIVALLAAANWNTLMFGGGILIDPVVLAFMGVAWLLLTTRHQWWIIPLMAVAYPLKETTLLFGGVLAAWAWSEYRSRPAVRALLVGSSAAAATAGIIITQRVTESDGSWDMGIKWGVLVDNNHVLNLVPLAVAIVPIALPAVWRILQLKRTEGWAAALGRPEAVGVEFFVAMLGYTWISHDLSPRLFFIGLPFAAMLAAEWFDSDDGAPWVRRIRSLPMAARVIPVPTDANHLEPGSDGGEVGEEQSEVVEPVRDPRGAFE